MSEVLPGEAPGHVGRPTSRYDGPLKVTGRAAYAAEFDAPGLLYGWIVSGTVARGRIVEIDTAAAEAVPGVVKVFTHRNRPRTAWFDSSYRDEVAPPGSPFRPLFSDEIFYSGQPIALVVAEESEAARYAARLLHVRYKEEKHATDLKAERSRAYHPPAKRSGMAPAKPRGDAEAALRSAPLLHEGEYFHPPEHHNPMEPHATTVVWNEGGALTVHDKTQGSGNSQSYICNVFGLPKDKVRVVTPFVGGAFGSGLRPQHQCFLAVMAALTLERSVRVVMTRQQMFGFGYRPGTIQNVALGANGFGTLEAIRHDAVGMTSRFEDYQENVVNWSEQLYRSPNSKLDHLLVDLDAYTPHDMRAPGGVTGMFALECAMDELAVRAGLDPLDLRLKNYSDRDQSGDKPFTSKKLREAFRLGAEAFGWSGRVAAPRARKEGRELVGYGMATGIWEAYQMKASVGVTLAADGTAEIASAMGDIGTGTYTFLQQVAADMLGLELEAVTVRLGDTDLPAGPVQGGSWTTATLATAVQETCQAVRKTLFERARKRNDSPVAGAAFEDVRFTGGRIALAADPRRGLRLRDLLQEEGPIEKTGTAGPNRAKLMSYARFTHSAVFAEVRVDEELGVIRVPRVVNAVAAGRIVNPKAARSQILGGVVWGIGMALHEETLADHALGRFMNHNLAEYHVPVNADIHDIEVIFVDEPDEIINPLGIKGLGEIGIVGVAAAIANAVYNATGKRVRDLPITLDKLLPGMP